MVENSTQRNLRALLRHCGTPRLLSRAFPPPLRRAQHTPPTAPPSPDPPRTASSGSARDQRSLSESTPHKRTEETRDMRAREHLVSRRVRRLLLAAAGVPAWVRRESRAAGEGGGAKEWCPERRGGLWDRPVSTQHTARTALALRCRAAPTRQRAPLHGGTSPVCSTACPAHPACRASEGASVLPLVRQVVHLPSVAWRHSCSSEGGRPPARGCGAPRTPSPASQARARGGAAECPHEESSNPVSERP
jgi:hypothetical protein